MEAYAVEASPVGFAGSRGRFETVAAWLEANERAVARAGAMFTEIRRAESYDLTALSVALRQLRNLALVSVTG